MTGFDRDLIGEGFDRGDAGVTTFREERTLSRVHRFVLRAYRASRASCPQCPSFSSTKSTNIYVLRLQTLFVCFQKRHIPSRQMPGLYRPRGRYKWPPRGRFLFEKGTPQKYVLCGERQSVNGHVAQRIPAGNGSRAKRATRAGSCLRGDGSIGENDTKFESHYGVPNYILRKGPTPRWNDII